MKKILLTFGLLLPALLLAGCGTQNTSTTNTPLNGTSKTADIARSGPPGRMAGSIARRNRAVQPTPTVTPSSNTSKAVSTVAKAAPVTAMSVSDFLAKRAQFDGKSVTLKGVIKFKYECPPCPKGAMCKPCAGNYITLADASGSAAKNDILINFSSENVVYAGLKKGGSVTVTVKYSSSSKGHSFVTSNSNGYFEFVALPKK